MKTTLLFLSVFLSANLFGQSWISATPFDDPNNTVRDVEVHNGDVYIGGDFQTVGGIVADRVAKWNGVSWSTVGIGSSFWNNVGSDDITDLCSSNDVLYAICGNSLYYLADMDTAFIWIYTGRDVRTNSKIYALGSEIMISGNDSNIYTGSEGNFSIFSEGSFTCFKEFNGDLYAAREGLFKWVASTWVDITGATVGNIDIYDLEVFQNKLLIAGEFNTIGGLSINNIAYYDGANYSAVGTTTLNTTLTNTSLNPIYDIEVQGNQFYICGLFFDIENLSLHYGYRFDGVNWYPVGGAGGDPALVMEFYNSELYIGGNMITYNASTSEGANYFLKLDGLSSIDELTTSKNLIQILDMMGRETSFKPNTPLIYVYDDGSIEKVFSVEY